jgi:deoxyribonuclease-2
MDRLNFSIFFCLSIIYSVTSSKYSCLNPSGEEVDWFSIFMMPKTVSKTNEITFGYFDSNSNEIKYIVHDKSNFPPISMSTRVDIQTVKNTNFFFWNDETGNSTSSTKAHSKGSMVYDKDGGYFLSHSLPKFPAIENDLIKNGFPDNAGIFAQSWLCISITKEVAIDVSKELNIINPQIYIKVEKDEVDSPANEIITKLIKNRGDPKLPSNNDVTILSKSKVKFTIFSKSKNFKELQWDEIIPNYFKDDFLSETWTKPERLPSVCDKKYQVLNVLLLKFGKFQFDYDKEHSKWGVSKRQNVNCFGDLNRTESQKNRGGLVVCFENAKLAETIRGSIVEYEECTQKTIKFLSEESTNIKVKSY